MHDASHQEVINKGTGLVTRLWTAAWKKHYGLQKGAWDIESRDYVPSAITFLYEFSMVLEPFQHQCPYL